jgi:hypothetical protein
MKATELRIGNWYQVMTIGGYWHNRTMTVENLQSIDGCSIDVAKPIPLTEEWLERFNWNPPKDIGVAFSTNTHEIYFVAGNYYKTIEYVHQLQNLYFALTGQELQTDETNEKVK